MSRISKASMCKMHIPVNATAHYDINEIKNTRDDAHALAKTERHPLAGGSSRHAAPHYRCDGSQLMTRLLRVRLSLLFFAQYFAAGAWLVPLGTYMSKSLGFDSVIALAYSTVGIATIISTLFVGVIADRYFAAQKVLSTLAFAAGGLLFLLSTITKSSELFVAVMLAHCLFYIGSIPIGVAIAFNSMSDPGQQYPGIRIFGSLGWIVAGFTVGLLPGTASGPIPMLMGSATYVLLGFFSLSLPDTPPRARGQPINVAGLFGLDILKSVRDISFWIFAACILLVTIPKKFYDSFANNFLSEKHLRFEVGSLAVEPTAIQAFGQVVEIATIMLIPYLISRIGIKWVMVLGMIGWIVRFALFAFGFEGAQPVVSMLVAGILMHGLSYDFLFVSGQIYVDRLFPVEMRSRAQAFYWFILSGLGVVVGALIAGAVYNANTVSSTQHNWTAIWLAPAFVTAVVAVLFGLLFREPAAADNEV